MSALHAEPAGPGAYRLLVRSIGMADAAVVSALRGLRSAQDADLARILYCAPSELLGGLTREVGTQLCEVLRQTGVDIELISDAESYEPGKGEYELALVIKRFDRMHEVVEETMRILGVDVHTAKRLVCACPAVLIGRVSQATVEALRRRYERVGVTVDASSTPHATFDVAIETSDEATSRLVGRLLASIETPHPSKSGGSKFLASELEAEAANHLWNELSRTPAKVRVLNRDFHRFDVRLESAPASEAMLELLIQVIGMSAAVAERALGQTPFVLVENVSATEMREFLESVHARGGRASAVLLGLQGFGLSIDPGGDQRAARDWIESIAGPAAAESFESLGLGRASRPLQLPGPFTKTQARWLQYELRKLAIKSRLVER